MKFTAKQPQTRSKSALSNAIAFLVLAPLLTQTLPVHALPISQPMQVAINWDDCVSGIGTSTDTYVIKVCQKQDKTAEIELENIKTGEKSTLSAQQVDNSGNVFRATLVKNERILTKIPPFSIKVPVDARQITTYELDVTKKLLSITKETNIRGNNKKTVQVEKLGGVAMS